jgi:hypothetical protein
VSEPFSEPTPEHVALLVAVRTVRFGGSRKRLADWLGVSYDVLYRWETSWNTEKPVYPPIFLTPLLEAVLNPQEAGRILGRYFGEAA